MKKINFILALAVFCFFACDKKNDQDVIQTKSIKEVSEEIYFGEYFKELVVYDESGMNSATIKIGTDDPAYFEMLTADNIKLIPVRAGQSATDAVNLFYRKNGLSYSDECQEGDEMSDDNEEDGIHVYSMILSKSLADDVDGVVLINLAPNPSKSDWQHQTDYAYGNYAHMQEAEFTGHNTSYVGYYGLKYVIESTLDTSTIVANYHIIRTNQKYSYPRNDCRLMIAYRMFKGANQSVQVEFKY